MKLSQIVPAKTDRAVIVGSTGSGKTYLVREMLKFRRFVVVLDTKGMMDWSKADGYQLIKSGKKENDEKVFQRLQNTTAEKILFKPSARWLRNDEAIEDFFQWIYWRGHTTLYIDELTSIADTHKMPVGYRDLLARGREKGIEVWTSTQRPSGIPQQVLTESENCYCFKLRHPNDKKKLFQMFGFSEMQIDDLEKFHFIYSKNGDITGPKKLER